MLAAKSRCAEKERTHAKHCKDLTLANLSKAITWKRIWCLLFSPQMHESLLAFS